MKAIKIIFAGIGLLLLVAVAVATYFVAYLDENKDLLADRISTVLGREIRIEKGVSMEWSLTPAISLEGLWIGNPEWAKGEYLAHAERALVRLRLFSLLQRHLELKQLTIQNADIALEEAQDGRRNWSFGGEGDSGFDFDLDALQVENSHLSYHSSTGEVQRADIPEVMFRRLGSSELEFKASFTYRDIPVSASLSSKPQVISLAGERPFQGKVEMPGTTLAVAGELKGLFELAKLEVKLQSERLDFNKSALALLTSTPVDGNLQKVDGRFTTAGDSRDSLIGNLSGDLKIGSAAVKLPAKKGEKPRELALEALSLTVGPKEAVRLKTGIVYEKQPYQIEVSGGLLADLFEEGKAWKSLKVKIEGQAGKKPLQITGDVGPLSALHAGRDVRAKLSVQQDDLKVRLDGTFASLAGLKGSRFAVDASGPSFSRLNPLLGLEMPDTPPFAVTAQVEGSDRRLQFRKLNVTSGKSDISGELSVPLVPGQRIEGTLESRELHLQTFLEHSDKPAGDAKPFLEQELPTGTLQGLDGSLRLKVGHLYMIAIELEQVSLDAAVDKGHLKLTMSAENERITADVDLKPVDTNWELALNHKGKMDLGELIDRKRYREDESQAPLELEMHLKGSGRSPAAMLQSAEGQFLMVIGEGELSETIARQLPLGTALYSLVSALLSKDKVEDRGKLECAVVQFDVSKGIATSSKGLALRTDGLNALGGGSLKLDTGEISLKFKTAQRKGLGISIVGVADRVAGITGTLNNPTVSLDVSAAAVYGAAAWATAGLSVVADTIFTRLTAFSNPCEHVLKGIKR
jgi:uncharacterized protein involved in outer membrane biogenesis